MSEIYIRIPDQQPELEAALLAFIKEEFNQDAAFTQEATSDALHKGSAADMIWLGMTIIATLEGTWQFAERAKRSERVKKLLAIIKKSGKSVYLKINKDQTVDLSKKSVSETMDLLDKKEQEDKKN